MDQEITKQIKAYEKALNTSDANAALAVYGSEPIFMAQNMEAFVGRAAVQASYEHIFKAIKLNVVFTIHEIESMGDDLAYVRTTSAGQTEILAAHKTVKEANNELFGNTMKIYSRVIPPHSPSPIPVLTVSSAAGAKAIS